MKKLYAASLLLILCLLMPTSVMAQQRESFPGAEGYGRYTTGGRGGKVYHVTTLEDNSQPGSFRYACNQSGARTIVFDVDGTIHLKSELKLRNPNVTIAGQTAPGDGICIADYPFSIATSNVIIRFMRFRLGNANVTLNGADGWDGLGALDQKDIIVDHCSVSWSIDECLSFSGCTRTTVQWCIVSQSLVNSGHSKGSHGYGGNWGGCKSSYHHNLLAHHVSRAPRLGPRATTQLKEQMDMRNNVIYNYAGEGCYGGEGMKVNIVNNVYIPGPGNPYSGKVKRNRITCVGIRTNEYITTYPASAPALHLVGKYYVDGNYNSHPYGVTAANFINSENQWQKGMFDQITWTSWDDLANTAAKQEEMKKEIKADTPIEYVYTNTHDYMNTFSKVCAYAGASLHRDELDTTIANEAKTMSNSVKSTGAGLNKGFINTQNDVVGLTGADGWPKLNAGTAQKDTDGDGIPDAWETANGLNPNDAADGAVITSDGYSNLEHYINSLVQDIVDNGNEGAKMLNGTLTYADAAVSLPAYDPNYVPAPDPDDENNDPIETVGNSWAANGSTPDNNTIKLDDITAEFLNNTSKGSAVGVGEWIFTNKSDVRGSENALEMQFTPTASGILKITFAGTIATSKSLNMFVDNDVNDKRDATDSNGVIIVSGVNLGKQTPPHADIEADDYITYELEGGKTYNFYAGGTKWRIRSFDFTVSQTGIKDIIVDNDSESDDGRIYNLMGIEVKGELSPGIYIRNGKKFLVK